MPPLPSTLKLQNSLNDPGKMDVKTFLKEKLPLYHGSYVKITVKPENTKSEDDESEPTESTNTEYIVSKDLLCKESPVFTRMLNGNFKEAREQTIVLEEMDGVVSAVGVGNFISWLYQGVVKIDVHPDYISGAIELARFADMYQVVGLESPVEAFMRNLIQVRANYAGNMIKVDRNTGSINADHIKSALNLPRGHAVRRLLAQASVAGFIQSDTHKFAELTVTHPVFASDLLGEVQKVLRTMPSNATIKDPISQENIRLMRSSKASVLLNRKF